MDREKILNLLVTIGMLLVAVAIVMPIASVMRNATPTPLFKYFFAAGALMDLAGRALSRYEGTDTRVKRLMRIEVWGAIFFCAGAFFLFYPPTPSPLGNLRDALAFCLAGGAIQIYTSIMLPRAIAKAEAQNEEAAKPKRKKGKS